MITARSLRRFAAAAAMTTGLLLPASHAFAATPPYNPTPGDISSAPHTPPPPHGPGDITSPLPGGDPVPCNPILASCNITSNPGGNGGNDGGSDNSDGGSSDDDTSVDATSVDQPVAAHPTFTG